MRLKHLFLAAGVALAALPGFAQSPTSATAPRQIPLKHTTGIKAVYQVSDLAEHDGYNKGLFYSRKLLQSYERQGVPANQVDLHLVYHSAAIPALLQDSAYQRLTGKSEANPNSSLVSDLTKMGVHVEICGDTMKQKDVQPADLLPGVDIVPGAYPRLIDLQLDGYAYIKFE